MPTHASLQAVWTPTFGDERARLCDVYRDMPRSPAYDVPRRVRALENPESPIALPGAVDLFAHDCIHAVLGRGLLQQDEAFVLGFTMGSARAHRLWHVKVFALCARRLYPKSYRFDAVDAEVFEFGVETGRTSGACDLAGVDFRSHFERPLGELRRALGVRREDLVRAYGIERERWPSTRASERLTWPGMP
jgi:hypothetical protein